jgi:elongation factor P--(R)-beta-lysine ligase
MSYARAGSLEALRARARMLARIRAFFAARGVLEVETPALSSAGVSDLALDSVLASARSLGVTPLYLHTSPEYAMKRLLADGAGDIYQIGRVFRDDELGRWHQPEFTLLEWYRIGFDDVRLMDEVEALLRDALAEDGTAWRSERVSYRDALARSLGVDSEASNAEIAASLDERGVDVPQGLAQDALLDLAFASIVVPSFAADTLTFVWNYPASQAALARLKVGTPTVAARFEVFARGIELANGFHELTDAAEQRRRFENEIVARRRLGRHVPPLDEAFLDALARGLPDCAGVAVGLDRLVALALGADGIAHAMAFVHRPQRG